jgi:predicted N-acyltransferase
MVKTVEQARVKVVERIADIPADAWDACANPPGCPFHPFTAHAFLKALEDADCAQPRTGWLPQHLVLEDAAGAVAGVSPCYLKSHSLGEYVFDHGWAEAFERAGGRYYPKLQVAVPFTPVTGRRLLVPEAGDAASRARLLVAGAVELARRQRVSSVHWTFLTEAEWQQLGALGLLQRTDQQFHWENRGYPTFDAFLDDLASRKRKQIRHERRAALSGGIAIEWRTGREIGEAHWDAFFSFYMDTGSRKWGRPYLNRRFFALIGERMAERVLLVLCRRGGRYVAGALNFLGSDTLYGRYWGAVEEHRFLHFEACYYQAIEYAIVHGLRRVEAGAQGPHKLARGYLPVTTRSAHWIADARLARAVDDYLAQERAAVDAEARMLAEHAPFRRDYDAEA